MQEQHSSPHLNKVAEGKFKFHEANPDIPETIPWDSPVNLTVLAGFRENKTGFDLQKNKHIGHFLTYYYGLL